MSPKFIKTYLVFISCIFLLTPDHAHSSRILAMMPIASYSHQMFFQPLWRELALRGHDMVVVTTDPTGENLPNFREISVKETYGPAKAIIDAAINSNLFTLFVQNQFQEIMNNVSVYQMNLPQIQALINDERQQFDLVILEHFPSLHMGFKHKYQCPMIGILSMDGFPASHSLMGNPVHGVLYPSVMLPLSTEMSLLERLVAAIFDPIIAFTAWRNNDRITQLTREVFGEDVTDVSALFDDTDMLFINANPLFNAVRPHTPGTINLAGGMHMKKPKPLPEDLKTFLDTAQNGVIYFSLGSNVKSKDLSPELRQTLLDTFTQLPYQILWKFEDDTLPGKPKNVKITPWAPQQDVLRHPNVKLFISQGGIQSLEETLYSRVPVIVLPFMGDQRANAIRVANRQIGLHLDPYTLSVDILKTSIQEVLTNSRYRENIESLARQIQDGPMTPLENAVWWTEYVLRHKGAQHLKGPRIPFYQYYYLDVLGFSVLILIVTMVVFCVVVKHTFMGVKRFLQSRRKQEKIKAY